MYIAPAKYLLKVAAASFRSPANVLHAAKTFNLFTGQVKPEGDRERGKGVPSN